MTSNPAAGNPPVVVITVTTCVLSKSPASAASTTSPSSPIRQVLGSFDQVLGSLKTPRYHKIIMQTSSRIIAKMASDKPKCSLLTYKGQRCSFAASEYYDHQPCCKKHYKYLKSKEDCSVCFYPMSTSTKTGLTTKLTCGHIFHTDCLSKCIKSECPLCRTQFDPALASKIYDSTIVQPLMKALFTTDLQSQVSAIECLKIILCSNMSTIDIQSLHRILYNCSTCAGGTRFSQMLALFDTISQKVKDSGSFDGITVIGRNDRLVIY